jgi:hypothetical protein
VPEQRAPNTLQPGNLEEAPFIFSYDPMNAKYALELVNRTFNHFETLRQQNHENRWLIQESLYLGWVPPKVWEGTTIPRAALGMPITFDQIESALPLILGALFEQSEQWFEVVAEPGMDPKDARAVQGYLEYVLTHLADDNGVTAIDKLALAVKSVLLYGNGGVLLEWDTKRNVPKLSNVDIKDLYIDTATPSGDIDEARSCVLRRLMTVEELKNLRDDDRMNIPLDDMLWYMAKTRPLTSGDHVEQHRDALRQIHRSPGDSDKTVLPSDQRIEVLVYMSKTRIIWVMNRQWVAYIGNNPYGLIPMAWAPCYTVPGRFYGLSIADVQEGNQRYTEALMNNRLDEVSLALHPPRIQKRGALMTPAQQRWRPGAVYTAGDAKDILFQQPTQALTNIYPELQYLEMLADKRTGINSMTQGVPRGGNVNRSATGVNAQTRGTTSRLQTITKHIETYMIVTMLYKLVKMVRTHVPPQQYLPSVQQGQNRAVQGSAFSQRMRFKINGASRMMVKEELRSVIGPVLQFLFNGPVMGQLAATGRTVDFDETFSMIQQATGIKSRFNLIRPMNQQEQQAQQQPPPEVQAEQARAQQDAQVRLQMGQMKAQSEEKKVQGDLQKEMIKKQPDPQQQAIDQQKAQMEMVLQRVKLEAEREKNKMEMEKKQLELRLKQQEAELKAASLIRESRIKTQAQATDAAIKQRSSLAESALKLRSTEEDIKLKKQERKDSLSSPGKKARVKKSK